MDILPRSAVDPVAWDEVVRQSPDGWLYATAAWLNAIETVELWELQDHSFAIQKNNRLVAVMPLHYTAINGLLASSGFGWTGPVIIKGLGEKEERKILQALHAHIDAIAEKTGAVECQLACASVTERSLSSRWGISPFLMPGFEDRSGYAKVIDLNLSQETLWAELSDDSRRMIRKAQQAGYSVKPVTWKDYGDTYYRLHEETYRRTGVTQHPKAYFDGMAQYVEPEGHVSLWAGFAPDGTAVAFHNSTGFGIGRCYHVGASATEHVESGINYWLFWEALCGAKASGALWYEAGEVFPAAESGKQHGLSIFKSKFGGELHRCFRATKTYKKQVTGTRAVSSYEWKRATIALVRSYLSPKLYARLVWLYTRIKRSSGAGQAHPAASSSWTEEAIRQEYERGDIYDAEHICQQFDPETRSYTGRLLQDRLQAVKEAYNGGLVVDLCCATGEHMAAVTRLVPVERALGIDFSYLFTRRARQMLSGNDENAHLHFVCGNAKSMPLRDGEVALLYCFSALYAIPGVEQVVADIARVLRPGGRAVLDFGNRRSLNRLVTLSYTHLPETFPVTLTEILGMLHLHGLRIRQHRCYQILPMWGDKPLWLLPLLLPFWQRVLATRVKGKMLDEWVSSLPLVRRFAFRHVLVCEKTGQGPSVHARYGTFQQDQREFFDALVTEEWHSYASDEWDDVRDFEVKQLMQRLKPKRILNIGCGTGYQDKAMAAYPGVETVEAIDYSAKSIEKAEEIYPHPKVRRYVADFLTMEETQRYDLIVSFQVFEHFDKPQAYLEKAKTLLAPGGVIAIVMPQWLRLDNRLKRLMGKEMTLCDPQHYREYTAVDVAQMAAPLGLKEAGGFAYGLSSAMVPGLARLPYRWRTRLGYLLPRVANNIAVFLVKA